jgi:hypothetical protein
MRYVMTDTYDPGGAFLNYYLGVLFTAGILVVPPVYAHYQLFINRPRPGQLGQQFEQLRFEKWLKLIIASSLATAYLSWHFAYGMFFDVFDNAWGFAILIFLLFVSTTAYLHSAFLSISIHLSDRRDEDSRSN